MSKWEKSGEEIWEDFETSEGRDMRKEVCGTEGRARRKWGRVMGNKSVRKREKSFDGVR